MKLRLTVTVVYDANPEYYDTSDPKEMAAIDEGNYRENPETLAEMLYALSNDALATAVKVEAENE